MIPGLFARSSLCAAFLTLATAERALADDTVIVTSGATTTEPTATGINRHLLSSGLFTLGVAYVPALVVAIESDRPEDNHLYAPVVGPWLDLAERDNCDAEGDCSGETVNKVLLVTDGIFQGLGALQIVGAFIYPETRTVTVANDDGTSAVLFNVTAASFGHGANGLLAQGEF